MVQLLNQTELKDPPSSLKSALKWIGPGWILSAAVIGSGELIATTTLGAQAGIYLLWVIILGCTTKVTIQIEYGKRSILSGLTTVKDWNLKGKKLGPFTIPVWLLVVYIIGNLIGQAGILGAAAQIVTLSLGLDFYFHIVVIGLAVIVALLGAHGKYDPIERLALLMNGIFVGTLLFCIFFLYLNGKGLSIGEISKGLRFSLPAEYVPLALAAFGLTGIAGGEIFMYPYWCIEKGYARWAGIAKKDKAEIERAKNWIKVMQLDVLIAMFIYTLTTSCFYLVGVISLHGTQNIPDGPKFILFLSQIFTHSLGLWAEWLFMICAFTVLFSTIFANTVGWSRVIVDLLEEAKILTPLVERSKSVKIAVWTYALSAGVIFMVASKPLTLILLLGIINATFLLVVSYKAIESRLSISTEFKPTPIYDAFFTISICAMSIVVIVSLWQIIYKV